MRINPIKVDMDIETLDLEGNEVLLQYKGKVNASVADKFSKKFTEYEEKAVAINSKVQKGELDESKYISKSVMLATELKMIYPEVELNFFMDNFTVAHMSEMITYLANQLMGLKKSG